MLLAYRRPFESTRQKIGFTRVTSSLRQVGEKPAATKGRCNTKPLYTQLLTGAPPLVDQQS